MAPSRKRKRSHTVSAAAATSNKGKRARGRSAPLEPRNRERIEYTSGWEKLNPTESEFELMEEIDECEFETLTPSRGHGVPAESVYGADYYIAESCLDANAVMKSQRQVVVFRPGDTAVFASEYDDTSNVWIGVITELRLQHKSDDEESTRDIVWLKVKWGWSGRDLSTLIKSFKAAEFAPFERALSEYVTIEDARTLVAMEYLHEWDESSLEPPELQPTTLFTRSLLSYSRKFLDPRSEETTCRVGWCNREYTYIPFLPGPQADWDTKIMHFCPRMTCRRWYHRECLVEKGSLEDPTTRYVAERGVRLLTVDPDSEHDYPMLSFHANQLRGGSASEDSDDSGSDDSSGSSSIYSRSPGAAPIKRRNTTSSAHPLTLASVLAEMSVSPHVLSPLPHALVQLAQCPIVRRPGPPADGWRPAGNVREVVLARRLVYAAIEGERIDVGAPALSPQELADSVGTRMWYAEPYVPFWERRARELESETWMEGPPVLCPKCGGAI